MRLLVAFLLIFSGMPVWAEPSARAVRARTHYAPAADEARRIAKLSLPSRRAALGQLDPHRLSAFTPDQDQPKLGMIRTGQHRPLEREALDRGRWDTLPDGSRVWRLAIHSPGAIAMRLHFTGFQAADGRVWVHDGSGEESQIGGPYAGLGPNGDTDFWSDVIHSDTVIVEYLPADASRQDAPFRVGEISHVYHEPKDTGARDAAAKCNLDVTCFAEWAESAKAVARIAFEDGAGSFVCSGTLLNTRNNSGDLLFLTANHCLGTDTIARTMQAFWNYQTSSCNGAEPSTRNVLTSLGARLLVTGDRALGDFSLVRLNSVPSGVTFSGWDPQEVAVGTPLTVIHHPAGDFKRIAFGNRVASSRSGDSYYSVLYSSGLTEGGSSGSGLFSSQLMLVGTLSNGPKADTPEDYCRLIPFADNYGKFSAYFAQLRDILEGRGVPTGPTTPPATGNVLASGVARTFTLPAVTTAQLINGTRGFTVEVPQGATRLEVRLSSTTSGADLDLYVRFGQDVVLVNGAPVADFKSEGAAADESISITPTSAPALRAGTYFIAFGVFTTNVAINASVMATVTTGSTTPPPTGGTALTSGTPLNFSIPAGTSGRLFPGFTITVPPGATRLDIRLASSTPNVDLDLFARFGTDIAVSAGNVVSDFSSTGDTATESITISPTSNPTLRAGTYFIGVTVFTANVAINVTLTATVTTGGSTPPPTGPAGLTSGAARNFTVAAVANPTLINGNSGFTIQVPAGAARLDVLLASTTANADLDLYVRFGSDVALTNGMVVADHKSARDTAISITPGSSPTLRAGTYFIAFGVFTTGININATVTATVTTTSAPPPAGVMVLTSGRGQTFTLPAGPSGRVFNGEGGYTVAVPPGATRLDIVLATNDTTLDVDLFARFGTDITVASGRVVADYRSEGPAGNERISIDLTTSPPLQAGTYFISLAIFVANVQVNGTLTATVTTASTPTPSNGPVVLLSGVRQGFNYPAATQALLNNGPQSFVIDVPPNATRLDIQLVTSTPGADVDLFAKFGGDTSVSDGSVVADYRSEGPDGNERITITADSTPPLKAGRYFISTALFTTNVAVTGTIIATFSTAAVVPPPPASAPTLVPGTPTKFFLPAVSSPTLYNSNYSFKVQVPEGAAQMRVQLRSDNPAVDVDLYVRYQADTEIADGAPLADYYSEGPTGNEAITITSSSSPSLRPGLYFISLGLFTRNVPSTGSILVTIERGTVAPTSSARHLQSGTSVIHLLPAVASPTLFGGAQGYRITVGPEHTRLAVSVRNQPRDVDVDLFVRFGAEATASDGRVAADARSANSDGFEDVVISGANLRPGVYFIALGLFTPNTQATGVLTATLSGETTSAEPEEKLTGRRPIGGTPIHAKDAPVVMTPIASKSEVFQSAAREDGGLLGKETLVKKRQPLRKVSE